jgi:predicted Zn-dependent protease
MMKTDSNLCPHCSTRAPLSANRCPECKNPLVLNTAGGIALWRLGEIRPAILDGVVDELFRSLHLPVTVQPSLLDFRPSRRLGWKGISANAFLNQVDRRARRRTVFSVGITEENIVPGAFWNYLFGYAYLGMPSCVVSLHEMSSDQPSVPLLVKRATCIAIHEIGHNCGLDHHGYDEDIDCAMTADTELDCLERLDEGTQQFCRACQAVVKQKLGRES